MRIAIPLAGATLAEQFSPATTFALYDVHDDTRAVAYLGRQTAEESGCSRHAGFLRTHAVEVVLAHDISQNAVNHLLEAGILAIKDAPLLSPDALIAHLVSGTLQATPPEAAMHGGGCGSGGCGNCCGGGHGHAHGAEHGTDSCEGGHTG
jgi:predicted Fe-Mo cluster-binding NifX family protein